MSRARTVGRGAARKAERRTQVMRRPLRGAAGLRKYAFTITGFSPAFVDAGTPTDTLINVQGGPFPGIGASVYYNGVAVPTTPVSGTVVQFTLTSAQAATGGFKNIQVRAGSDASNSALFPVRFPSPTLASISPTFAFLGAGATGVTGTGTGIYAECTGAVDGAAVASTPTPLTSIALVMPSSVVDAPGDHSVTITNPVPGGGTSAARTFQSRYRTPTLVSLSPSNATIGAGNVTVTATVTNAYDPGVWPAGSEILIDGTPVATTYLDATHVRFVIPSTVTATGGPKAITFRNPTTGGGGGTTAALTFSVGFLAPAISSLLVLGAATGTPPAITYGGGATTVRVLGGPFYPGGDSAVNANGSPVATTYVNSGELRFSWTPSAVEDLSITVVNNTAGGGGGPSNAKTLSITPPITSLEPVEGFQYDNDGIPLKVNGGPFPAGAVASMSGSLTSAGTEVPTTRFDSTRLDVLVPGAQSANLGNRYVRVRNATGKPDSQASAIYFINIFDPLTDGNGAFAAYDADHVTLDTTAGRTTDVVGLQDIVGGVGPFNNTTNVAQNPVLVAADTGINNHASIDYNGTTDLSGTTTIAPLPPLATTIFPPGDWTMAGALCPRTCTTNDSTPYNNHQMFSSDSNPGVRVGLGLRTNGGSGLAGSVGLLEFWMFDGASFKKVSQPITFGAWHYFVVKKAGTTLSISVNGAAFTNTPGVGNLSATTQRLGFGGSFPGAVGGRKYYDGRFRLMINANWNATDIARFQNHGRYELLIV